MQEKPLCNRYACRGGRYGKRSAQWSALMTTTAESTLMAPDLWTGQQFFSLSVERIRESVPFLRSLTLEALPISCRLPSLWLPGSSHWGHRTNKKGPSKHLPASLSRCWREGETAQANKGIPVGSRVRGAHSSSALLSLLTLLPPPFK